METMEVIKDAITLILFAISVYGWIRTSSQDKEDRVREFTKLNWKMDQNCRTLSDMDKSVEKLTDTLNGFATRLAVVEEQIRVSNHRIDDLEKGKEHE